MLTRLRNNQRLKQQKYAAIWMPIAILGAWFSLDYIAMTVDPTDYVASPFYFAGTMAALLGFVAWGIIVPKRRDNFYCPQCQTLLGTRQFLQFGSEFRGQMVMKYGHGCPVCNTPLFPVEAKDQNVV